MEGASQVGVDHLPPVVEVVLEERRHGHIGVVGDQNIKAARRAHHAGHHRLHLLSVADVRWRRYAADLVRKRSELRGVPQVIHRHHCPLACEPAGVACAHALGSAGDQGHLSCQPCTAWTLARHLDHRSGVGVEDLSYAEGTLLDEERHAQRDLLGGDQASQRQGHEKLRRPPW